MKTYTITTFGCQMNVSDSERVEAVCRLMGYEKAENQWEADLFIINTCSIRQKAEDKVIGMGKRFNDLKSKKPEIKVLITGCMVKRDLRQEAGKSKEYQAKYEKKLKKQMPWVDFFVEIKEISKIPELIGEKLNEKIDNYFAIKPKYNSKFQAFVPISTGCNKFCTFCIVPFTRGKEVSRDYKLIYDEVEKLIGEGFKEITLLGQNVNSWRKDNKLRTPITKLDKNIPEEDFANLLKDLSNIDGDYWLRFTSSHPYDINSYLIEVMKSEKKIAKQLHFALQSGSNTVLKRMNRHYSREEFKEKVLKIKEKIPEITITTDVIVGFCGETDEEFMDTVKLCEELKFDQIYISEYSQRQGTIASKFYKDDIERDIKARRKEILDEVLKAGVAKNNEKLIGSKQKVLIYKTKSKNRDGIFGRTSGGKDVLIRDNNLIPGNFYNVEITGFQGFCLEGELHSSTPNEIIESTSIQISD